MDTLLFVVMGGLIVYIGYNNFTLIRRYKQNKEYIECYEDVLNDAENCYERINNFIEKEKTEEFKNKAKVIKLYYELGHNIETDTLAKIDLVPIFCKKNSVDDKLVNLNSDTFVFIMLAMAKAHSNNDTNTIELLSVKLNSVDGLQSHLEYQLSIAFSKALLSNDDKGIALFNSLLEGAYTDYKYEKNMIGLYKRIAAMMLIFLDQEVEDYFKSDMHQFAKPIIGERFLKDLGLYEKYKPVDEEVIVEENK